MARSSRPRQGWGRGRLPVTGSGAKSWIFRFTLRGQSRAMGLGSAGTFSLAEARDKAPTCRKLCDEGPDPIDARRQRRQAAALESAHAATCRQCPAACIESHEAGWRNENHGARWRTTLEACRLPIVGDLSVQAIDTGLAIKAIAPIWTAKPEAAVPVRGRIAGILDGAKARGFRAGENPARWRGLFGISYPAKPEFGASPLPCPSLPCPSLRCRISCDASPSNRASRHGS